MIDPGIDRLARALARTGSRRWAALTVAAILPAGTTLLANAKPKRDQAKKRNRDHNRTKDRKRDKNRKGNGSGNESFPRSCERFVISAGTDPDDKFRHIDDDLHIELIAKGRRGGIKVLLRDDNNSPNGPNGDHLKVGPFTARVGDRIHIVARNEVTGGCELDEIWLHCVEGKGGRIKLTDRVTPEECRNRANSVGVFFEETIRIKNN